MKNYMSKKEKNLKNYMSEFLSILQKNPVRNISVTIKLMNMQMTSEKYGLI